MFSDKEMSVFNENRRRCTNFKVGDVVSVEILPYIGVSRAKITYIGASSITLDFGKPIFGGDRTEYSFSYIRVGCISY